MMERVTIFNIVADNLNDNKEHLKNTTLNGERWILHLFFSVSFYGLL